MTAAFALTNITPNGISGEVHAIITYGGNTIVAGSFTSINNVSCGNIASYDGVTWSAYGGDGIVGIIYSMDIYNSFLYFGGYFSSAGGIGASNISRSDGTTWDAIPGLTHIAAGSGVVFSLQTESSGLRVGGAFTKAGDITVNNDARWTSNIENLGDVQSGCELTCALCGQCGANVQINNASCQYQFTLSPAADCCREASYENVYVSVLNHGSLKTLDSERLFIEEKCVDLHAAIESSSYLQFLPLA